LGWHSLAPHPSAVSFMEWWEQAAEATCGLTKKGLNSLIALSGWIIWNHRNICVFDGLSPSVPEALIQAREELRLWEMAGAKGLLSCMLERIDYWANPREGGCIEFIHGPHGPSHMGLIHIL
jgi:hypothetical protein